MGPRSGDRGYGPLIRTRANGYTLLQWVHGRVTVVMAAVKRRTPNRSQLQWVHGRVTVVMCLVPFRLMQDAVLLQWVHGRGDRGYAVVSSMARRLKDASMGPRSGDRG